MPPRSDIPAAKFWSPIFPDVDIGSTIEVEFEITSKDKPFVSGFESFQIFDDLEKKGVQLTAPADLPVANDDDRHEGFVTATRRTRRMASKFSAGRRNMSKRLPAECQLPPEWVYLAGVGLLCRRR